MTVEQTKGYFSVKGKIWGLNNKEPKEFGDTKRLLSFGVQLSKENSLFLQVGEWKNTKLNIKIKGENDEKPVEVNEQEGIDKIKEIFKDGDSVFINARAEVDTYYKKINFLINQIYIEKEPINFDDAAFAEINELNQTVVILEKPVDKEVKAGVATFKGEMIEQVLKLSDPDINAYFVENAKVGDLMKLSISVNRKPNYVEDTVKSERKTLKGKTVQDGKRVIDKDNPYTESLEITDVDLEKTEKKKYSRAEIQEALDAAIIEDKAPDKKGTEATEEELPY